MRTFTSSRRRAYSFLGTEYDRNRRRLEAIDGGTEQGRASRAAQRPHACAHIIAEPDARSGRLEAPRARRRGVPRGSRRAAAAPAPPAGSGGVRRACAANFGAFRGGRPLAHEVCRRLRVREYAIGELILAQGDLSQQNVVYVLLDGAAAIVYSNTADEVGSALAKSARMIN